MGKSKGSTVPRKPPKKIPPASPPHESSVEKGNPAPATSLADFLRSFWGPELLPWGLVAAVVLFNLWTLRAERLPVQNLNDSAVHVSMIRWAAERWSAGDIPLDGWFPYLGLGLPQFHHYQSLPHILAGLPAVLIGAQAAFSWSLYLLLALWPLCVFWTVRLFGWGRWEAAFAAAVSPLLVSMAGYGYEYSSYTWQGLGVWSQLWAMWLLPLSWAFSWRAISGRGSYVPAALTTALAIALHFLTGYLAGLSIGVLILITPSRFRERMLRGFLIGVGALVAASWVVVPLLLDANWSNQTRFGGGGGSHGARKVMGWLLTGGIFDGKRLPVISVLVAFGFYRCIMEFRKEEQARAVLFLGLLSLLLFFGRPTLGALLDLLPGGQDLIYRRFIVGVQLAGIILAGLGGDVIRRFLKTQVEEGWPALKPASVQMVGFAVAASLLPAFHERADYHARGGRWIREQANAERESGRDFAALTRFAKERGPGRVYAGTIWGTSWGDYYKVGRVPAYAILLSQGVDAMGFTLRTVSLSSDIEVAFAENNPSHYDLMNVRYLIMPEDRKPAVPATRLEQQGPHVLWEVSTSGYARIVDTVPPVIKADRGSVGPAMDSFLASKRPAQGLFSSIAFNGEPARPSSRMGQELVGPPGEIERQSVALSEGIGVVEVIASRRAVVLLKATYHPRWKVSVDGKPARTQMVSPSYVGVEVPKGRHSVRFVYRPFPLYWLLGLLSLGVMVGLRMADSGTSRLFARNAPVGRGPKGN